MTLDSGAGASVFPRSWLENGRGRRPSDAMKLIAANGERIRAYGPEMVHFKPLGAAGKKGPRAAIEFHVADTTKALASAAAVVNSGHCVVLRSEGSYIQCEASGRKIPLRQTGGTFVFDVEFEKGVKVCSIEADVFTAGEASSSGPRNTDPAAVFGRQGPPGL